MYKSEQNQVTLKKVAVATENSVFKKTFLKNI